jgi:hypothetical protein
MVIERINEDLKDKIPSELIEEVVKKDLNSYHNRTNEFEARLKVLSNEWESIEKSKNNFKLAYDKLRNKITNNNSNEYALSNVLKKEEEKEEVKEVQYTGINVSELTEEQENYILDIFKQLLIKNYYLTGEGLNIDPATCLKSDDYKDSIFRSVHSFVVSWEPCSNVLKKAEDQILMQEIIGLNSEIQEVTTTFENLLKSYLDKINILGSPLPNVRGSVEDTRIADVLTYTNTTILTLNNLPAKIEALEKKVMNRISLGLKLTIKEQFVEIISKCLDVDYHPFGNNVDAFNTKTLNFQNILNGYHASISAPNSLNDALTQKINDLKYYFCYFSYLFEFGLQDRYFRRLNFAAWWYALGSYNYIDEGKFEIPQVDQLKQIENHGNEKEKK